MRGVVVKVIVSVGNLSCDLVVDGGQSTSQCGGHTMVMVVVGT
jgi:hypothetical protein